MPSRPLILVDRYLLTEALRPLGATLALVMAALLMERLLRLFRLVTGGGGPLDLVAQMAMNLVPHYLALALPAALFAAVALMLGRLSADGEIEALRAAGLSMRRAARPLFLLAGALAGIALAVGGWLQPLGRYGYRALVHMVTQGVWNGVLPERTLVQAGEGLVVSAERVGAGGKLAEVFVRRRLEDGTLLAVTASRGLLSLAEGGEHMRVLLADGVQMRLEPGRAASWTRFSSLTEIVSVRVVPLPFRARGIEERELTLPELVLAAGSAIPPRRLAAEMHGRLVRVAAMPFLPMLAAGLALGVKRAWRGGALAAGVAALFLFHHGVLTAESLAGAGRVPAGPALWGVFAPFAALSAALFLRLDRRPAGGLR